MFFSMYKLETYVRKFIMNGNDNFSILYSVCIMYGNDNFSILYSVCIMYDNDNFSTWLLIPSRSDDCFVLQLRYAFA